MQSNSTPFVLRSEICDVKEKSDLNKKVLGDF